MTDLDLVRSQAQEVIRSGVLGKTRSYVRLLEYLVECTVQGRSPKELEIATEVFGKGADFDPSQDSLVRVYAHNLRQKLEHYYADQGREQPCRITIPRGEYRVAVAAREEESQPVPSASKPARGWWWAAAGGALGTIVLGAVVLLAFDFGQDQQAPPTSYDRIAQAPVWADFFDDDLPTLLVVGDYYIFAELNKDGDVNRLIRDFSINSGKDLDELFMRQPELTDKYQDLDLTYLPRASAFAIKDLLRVLYTSNKPVRVTSMSELNASDLKSNHIIYVGYVSALDKLMELVFASSGLTYGMTFDELIDRQTGRLYASGAGLPLADKRHYRDYGLFSTFPGPGGNQFMIIAGTRDAGVMHTAHAVTDLSQIAALENAVPNQSGPPAFEALYEVTGFDRTSLDAMLVYSAPLDYHKIWGGELLTRLSSEK
jgi:hypothetical protein